ncbi:MAG TPA: diguanylate cyclase, partial [Gemmatimonadaceae bacterium]|nr:diguanylate cyclase [Gemmatimonadaceae bacterium]
ADAVRRDSDLVARHEDDAFAMLIPDASVEAALSIAERARATIAERGNRPVTVSFGVAADIPRSGVDPLSVVATAEDALRHVKNLGGNRSYTSERSIRKPASQRFPRTALDTE